MFLTDVTSVGATPLLEKTLAFTEAHNRVLATNIANITTPGYRAKQLDIASFQQALRDAAERRKDGGELHIDGTDQLSEGEGGFLQVTAGEEPPENVLFHDGTNGRIERQMALLAENTMMHQMATEMLKGRFEGLEKAIRGRA